MKDKFSEYYKIDDNAIKEHWAKDVFSFDANVLLNLYRYTPKTREAFFNILEEIKDRIWISYQAAFEYQENRLTVINAQKEAYKDIRETLEKKKNEIETKLNSFKKHPYLEASQLKTQIESAFNSIIKDLDNLEKNHPDYLDKDPIWDKLTALLQGKVGDDFTNDDLEKVYREGKKRYDEKVPPGYMDLQQKKDAGNRSLYGDVIVWKQVIDHAKIITDSIILITDDLKDDWWYKFKGKTIGPRSELIKEFKAETQKRINIYRADNFLELANKNLKTQATKEAIDEVRKVRMADEKEINRRLIEFLVKMKQSQNQNQNTIIIEDHLEKSDFEKAIEESIIKSQNDAG